jgi:beta-mannosidase
MDAAADELRQGVAWEDLDVEPWWPNGEGLQPLYDLEIALLDRAGLVLDSVGRRLGFTTVEWTACEGAPPGADPWLCLVNGRQTFLQGVNWTPIRPNFADVTDDQYRHLLSLYRDMGCTLLRVWGGAVLEKEIFYSLCDEYGLLVWQEFPLSSSGLDNRPPDSAAAVEEMAEIVESYIERRGHHVSLAIWCGGNELQDGAPITFDHPMISRIADIVGRRDPDRRFLPSSPSGPRFSADAADFGKGVHWDVHGPWKVGGELDGEWRRYWEQNDALFHSEVGVSGASPASIIRGYKGNLPELPGTRENPLWRRSSWWIDWPFFLAEHGREPADLEEYVAWSQDRQRHGLAVAAEATRARFPRCGGFLVWMGHDSFPCTVNLSVVDFDGRLKPAGSELGNVYRSRARRRVDDSALS